MVPFCPFYFRAPLLKPNSRKKGTLIIKRLLKCSLQDSSGAQGSGIRLRALGSRCTWRVGGLSK